MGRFKFSLPLFAVIPVSIGIFMLWGFLAIFDGLRFMQCPAWVPVQPPPQPPVALLGTVRNRLYIETANHLSYCLRQGQWTNCLLPPYGFQPDRAPAWLMSRFESAFPNGTASQVIRSDGFSEVIYYSLLTDKRVFSCSTNFSAEIENIFSSGLFLWLLIPMIGMIWSAISFFKIFIEHGEPTLWDFWGRGERIK